MNICVAKHKYSQPYTHSLLDKYTIEMEIVPYISSGKREFSPIVPLVKIISAILYNLKTGVQWRYLPIKQLFSFVCLSWQSVYLH